MGGSYRAVVNRLINKLVALPISSQNFFSILFRFWTTILVHRGAKIYIHLLLFEEWLKLWALGNLKTMSYMAQGACMGGGGGGGAWF